MHGRINSLSLAAVFREIATHQGSGILHALDDDRSVRVQFRGGSVADATDEHGEELGEHLAQTGRAEPSALELASNVMKETGLGLARTLVEMSVIPLDEMQAIVTERAKARVFPLFGWASGEYRFGEGESSPEGQIVAELSAFEAILQGTRQIADPALIQNSLGGVRARLRRPAVPDRGYEAGALSDSELLVLDLCRPPEGDQMTLQEVAAVSLLDADETLQCLHTLVAVGALEIAAAESPSSPVTAAAPAIRPAEPTDLLASLESDLGRRGVVTPETAQERPTALGGGLPEPAKATQPMAAGPSPRKIGRYIVQETLGRGSMGLVVSARDPEIDRTVAIKVIETAIQLDEAQLKSYEARFRQEAKAAGKLLHPGVVAVFDAGRAEDGAPYLVMEYVQGETLKEKFDDKPAEPAECRRIAVEVLDALGFAHENGIVHRDIKPQNILITEAGRTKVMDFGIAHVVGSELTQANELLGSPAYMAPEQLYNAPIDARTDLFGLGVVLYWMLTGKMPFEGDSFGAIATGILTKDPVPPNQLRAGVPPYLNDIVLRCLAKGPADRFASAQEMKEALTAPRAAPPARRAPGVGEPAKARTRPSPAGRRLGPALLIAGVLAIGLSAFLLWPGGETKPSGTPAPPEAFLPGGEPKPAGGEVRLEPTPVETARPLAEALQSPVETQPQPEATPPPAESPPAESTPAFAETPQPHVEVRAPPVEMAPPTQAERAPQISSADRLFREARAAYGRGDLEASRETLESILEQQPHYYGASELLLDIKMQLVRQRLPISISARHKHRIRGCDGRLTLADGRIEYRSEKHGTWRWMFEQIVRMERKDSRHITLTTNETEMLKLGGSKNYDFELGAPISRETWNGYRRIADR